MHIDGKKTKHVNGMHELSCNLKAVSAILRKGVSAMQLKWNNGHTRSGIELRFGLGLGSGLQYMSGFGLPCMETATGKHSISIQKYQANSCWALSG